MKRIFLIITVSFCLASLASTSAVSAAHGPEWTVKKALGDLNGDGIKEVAVEKWSSGSGGSGATVTIVSGTRMVLPSGAIDVGTSTNDGYIVVGRQIVAWQGDWDDQPSKFKPHRYIVSWYGWDNAKKLFVLQKRGETKKAYSASEITRAMPYVLRNVNYRSLSTVVAGEFLRQAQKGNWNTARKLMDTTSSGMSIGQLKAETSKHGGAFQKLPPIENWSKSPSIQDQTYTVYNYRQPKSGLFWTLVVDDRNCVTKLWSSSPEEAEWD